MLRGRWDQFNFDAGTWTKPSADTKQKREHTVPLSAPALQMLTEIQANADGEYVFAGRRSGQPLKDIKYAWARICKLADLKDFRIHDIRHTYASILASSGQSLHIIGELLGHTRPETTHRYAHIQDDALREATERVGAVVSSATSVPAEIIEIEKHTG